MKLVSVIIPVYNVEKYLNEAINSIINQSYNNLEIILVNDGSTDRSFGIIKEFRLKDNRIKIINQENKGLSEARNSGLRVAKGKYIYFFDSDDILELNAISECVNLAENQNLEIVLFDAVSFKDDTREKIYPEMYRLTGEAVEGSIYEGKYFLDKNRFIAPVWLKFLRLDFLNKNNLEFYKGILHEDELFSPMAFAYAKRVGYINKVFFNRRLRKNSIMSTKVSEKNIIGHLTVARELRKKNFNEEIKKLINLRIKLRIEIITSLVVTNGLDEKYLRIVKNEFKKYIGIKAKIKLYFPFVLKIKNKIKNI